MLENAIRVGIDSMVVFNARTFIADDDLDIGDTRELGLDTFGESLSTIAEGEYSDKLFGFEFTDGRGHHIGREFHQLSREEYRSSKEVTSV